MFGRNRGDNRCSELLRFCVEVVGRSKRLKVRKSGKRGIYMWVEWDFETVNGRFTRRARRTGDEIDETEGRLG